MEIDATYNIQIITVINLSGQLTHFWEILIERTIESKKKEAEPTLKFQVKRRERRIMSVELIRPYIKNDALCQFPLFLALHFSKFQSRSQDYKLNFYFFLLTTTNNNIKFEFKWSTYLYHRILHKLNANIKK